MPDFYGFCITLLAAVGIVSLVWMFTGLLLRPRNTFPMTVLVRARTAEELTEATCRYDWLRRWSGENLELIIISNDLEPEAERYADLYASSETGAAVCRAEDIRNMLDAR